MDATEDTRTATGPEHPAGTDHADEAAGPGRSRDGADAEAGRPEAGRPEAPAVRLTLPGWLARLRGPVSLGAAALIAVSLVLRVLVLRDSYFVEDDLLFVGNAYGEDFTLDYLTRVHKGHFMPGAIALTWVLSRAAPYDWALVSAVTLVAQALLGVLALRLLRTLFGGRPAILLPLALFLFCPLTFPAFAWWAAAINAIPLQLALVLALTAQVRFARGEGARYGRRALIWCVAGMAFSTKGVFAAFLLFALTTAYLRDRETGWLRSMWRELRANRWLWATHAAVLAAYTLVYLDRMDTAPGEGAAAPKPGVAADLISLLLGRTFPSGAVGGPVSWTPTPAGGLAAPSGFVVALSWAVLAVTVVATLVYRRRAHRAWLTLTGYLVFADAIPTVIARGSYLGLVGAETRYVADAALVLAVCLGCALLPVEGETGAYRRPLPERSSLALVAGLTAGAYLVLSVFSVEAYRATLNGQRVRAYLDTAAAELAAAPDTAVIYPAPVPPDIVLPVNGERRLTDRLLAPLARPVLRARMAHPEPTEDARVFNREGRLVRMNVAPGFFAARGPDERCMRTLLGAMSFPDAVSFGGRATVGGLSYSADRPASVTVEVGGERTVLSLRKTAMGLVQFPVHGIGRGMRIEMNDPEAPVCVIAVALGAPAPEGEGPS
ncbi:hypothetical protein GCM10027187_10780 [Streptosporangium sandarakinum]|uniref:4-amino-4-deoxy-L-arabinose transferase n=1 Tax=Streptosporangium sandarakinum TaxID=1260955 RepID=A0A852UU58_9ACTN|nr:hypothetical protein [Streptosporangium sandarakinum]NYF39769.1 hypothetical protein [Streptosporangium sandarakinum]